jgi:predicted nucleic acid-binding OB-fold protein
MPYKNESYEDYQERIQSRINLHNSIVSRIAKEAKESCKEREKVFNNSAKLKQDMLNGIKQ